MHGSPPQIIIVCCYLVDEQAAAWEGEAPGLARFWGAPRGSILRI